jgi:hypothetical protein
MTLDEKIHFVLDKMNGSTPIRLKTEINVWLKRENETADDLEIFLITYALVFEQFITFDTLNDGHVITHTGRKINETGGWNNFILVQKLKSKREQEKAENDLKISKWLVKTRWWPLIISTAGLIVAFAAFMKKGTRELLQPDNKIELHEKSEHCCPANQPTRDTLKNVPVDSLK